MHDVNNVDGIFKLEPGHLKLLEGDFGYLHPLITDTQNHQNNWTIALCPEAQDALYNSCFMDI